MIPWTAYGVSVKMWELCVCPDSLLCLNNDIMQQRGEKKSCAINAQLAPVGDTQCFGSLVSNYSAQIPVIAV